MDTKLQLLTIGLSGFALLVASSRAFFARGPSGPRSTVRGGAKSARHDRSRSVAPAPKAASPGRAQPAEDGGFSLVPIGDESAQIAAPVATRRASAEARIRDRYILARFPGVMRKSEDLADADAVIKAARLYFEDGLAMRGVELLQFASEMDPSRESLWLARLQMHFLLRDAAGFAGTARRMRRFHQHLTHWTQIAALGRHLGLTDKFFSELGVLAGPAPKPGSWPELPDWLQAPWDLTPEVGAADMRSRLLAATECAAPHAGLKEAA